MSERFVAPSWFLFRIGSGNCGGRCLEVQIAGTQLLVDNRAFALPLGKRRLGGVATFSSARLTMRQIEKGSASFGRSPEPHQSLVDRNDATGWREGSYPTRRDEHEPTHGLQRTTTFTSDRMAIILAQNGEYFIEISVDRSRTVNTRTPWPAGATSKSYSSS